MRHITQGTRIQDYEIQHIIGSGNFSRVFSVIDTSDIRRPRYALLELTANGDAQEVQLRRTFERTASILMDIRSTKVPQVFKFFEHQNNLYIVEEYIEGQNYSAYLASGNCPKEQELEVIFQDVLTGLAELHRKNIVHRDIKPSNLMRRPDGSTVIVDFGSACDLSQVAIPSTIFGDAPQQSMYTRIYTPGYAHPDQTDGIVAPSRQWDLYALGITFIALRLGTDRPWEHYSVNGRYNPAAFVELVRNGGEYTFAPRLKNCLLKILDPRSCKYTDASAALKDFLDYDKKPPIDVPKPPSEPPKTPPQITKPPGAKSKILAAKVAVSLAAFATASAGIYWLVTKQPSCPMYVASDLHLPIPDRGFAARFKYPNRFAASQSQLEVFRKGKIIARQKATIQGFIWIKSMQKGISFPPGSYKLRLLVPSSLPHEENVTLTAEFPAYIGESESIKLICKSTH